jgi:hypothetical protein
MINALSGFDTLARAPVPALWLAHISRPNLRFCSPLDW